jgi:hypothetical protein
LASGDVVKVFENIFENAIEAMERMQDKLIQISTWEDSAGLHVRVVDSGEGIDLENIGRVFDPFFTTRSYANHVGLGLPVAAGILKEHQAVINLQSQRAKGTRVDILFAPKGAAATSSLPKPPPTMRPDELPRELPKMAAPSAEEVNRAMQDTEVAKEKLTDVNVDSLLELPPEETPLQFLDGMGFGGEEEKPAPTMTKPMTPPPSFSMPPKAPPPPQPMAMPPPATLVEDVEDVEKVEAAALSALIDKPVALVSHKTSALDGYKVEVRRPGKRN